MDSSKITMYEFGIYCNLDWYNNVLDIEDIMLKLNDLWHEVASLKHRMDSVEEKSDNIQRLAMSVQELALNMKNMLGEQKEQNKRLSVCIKLFQRNAGTA